MSGQVEGEVYVNIRGDLEGVDGIPSYCQVVLVLADHRRPEFCLEVLQLIRISGHIDDVNLLGVAVRCSDFLVERGSIPVHLISIIVLFFVAHFEYPHRHETNCK